MLLITQPGNTFLLQLLPEIFVVFLLLFFLTENYLLS